MPSAWLRYLNLERHPSKRCAQRRTTNLQWGKSGENMKMTPVVVGRHRRRRCRRRSVNSATVTHAGWSLLSRMSHVVVPLVCRARCTAFTLAPPPMHLYLSSVSSGVVERGARTRRCLHDTHKHLVISMSGSDGPHRSSQAPAAAIVASLCMPTDWMHSDPVRFMRKVFFFFSLSHEWKYQGCELYGFFLNGVSAERVEIMTWSKGCFVGLDLHVVHVTCRLVFIHFQRCWHKPKHCICGDLFWTFSMHLKLLVGTGDGSGYYYEDFKPKKSYVVVMGKSGFFE